MSSCSELEVEEAVEEYRRQLELRLPNALSSLTVYWDEKTILKVVDEEKVKIGGMFHQKICNFTQLERDELVQKLCQKLEEVVKEVTARNDEYKSQYESSLKERVNFFCKDFKSSLLRKLVLNPEIDMESLEKLVEDFSLRTVSYFEVYEGTAVTYEEQKKMLNNRLARIANGLREKFTRCSERTPLENTGNQADEIEGDSVASISNFHVNDNEANRISTDLENKENQSSGYSEETVEEPLSVSNTSDFAMTSNPKRSDRQELLIIREPIQSNSTDDISQAENGHNKAEMKAVSLAEESSNAPRSNTGIMNIEKMTTIEEVVAGRKRISYIPIRSEMNSCGKGDVIMRDSGVGFEESNFSTKGNPYTMTSRNMSASNTVVDDNKEAETDHDIIVASEVESSSGSNVPNATMEESDLASMTNRSKVTSNVAVNDNSETEIENDLAIAHPNPCAEADGHSVIVGQEPSNALRSITATDNQKKTVTEQDVVKRRKISIRPRELQFTSIKTENGKPRNLSMGGKHLNSVIMTTASEADLKNENRQSRSGNTSTFVITTKPNNSVVAMQKLPENISNASLSNLRGILKQIKTERVKMSVRHAGSPLTPLKVVNGHLIKSNVGRNTPLKFKSNNGVKPIKGSVTGTPKRRVKIKEDSSLIKAMTLDDLSVDDLESFKISGADFNAVDEEGDSILLIAVGENQDLKIIKKILEFNGNTWNKLNNEGLNVLMMAARVANLDALKFFIDQKKFGINVNAKDSYGCTALHWLFDCETDKPDPDYTDCLHELLKSGANFLARNEQNRVPLEEWILFAQQDFYPALVKLKDELPITKEMASSVLTLMVKKPTSNRSYIPFSFIMNEEFDAIPSPPFVTFFTFLVDEKGGKLLIQAGKKLGERNKEKLDKIMEHPRLTLKLKERMKRSGRAYASYEDLLVSLLACKSLSTFMEACLIIRKICKA